MITKQNLDGLGAGVNPSVNQVANANIVQVAAYSPTNNCQTGAPPQATQKGTELDPFKLINGMCGVIGFEIDANTHGSGDEEISFGGPFPEGIATTNATLYGRAGGFNVAGLVIGIEGFILGAGATWASALGVQLFNTFNSMGFSHAIEQLYVQNIDSSNAINAGFLAQTLETYKILIGDDFNISEGGSIQPVFTQVGGGNLSNVSWNFTNPIALTTATGVFMTIPPGLDLTLYACVSFIEANKLYNPCSL